MAHTLSKFKSTLTGGGARPNLFEVELTNFVGIQQSSSDNTDNGRNKETGNALADKFSILCKAAALPASNIAPIDVPFRGRIFKVAGDRTFDTWTVTVINDIDFSIRRAMEYWMQTVGQYQDSSGAQDPNAYMSNAIVKQLGRGGSNLGVATGEGAAALPGSGSGLYTVAAYQFYDIFPTNISQIDLSYDTSDTIEEFTVEFQVQYWTPIELSAARTE
jgi:hypothetical protein